MRSTKNTRSVLVGIFIFIALVIFIVGILTLGGQRKTFANTIDLMAVFDDVNGLQKGSNVWYSGVKIGTVKSISFNKAGSVDVAISIEENTTQFIHKDAFAKVGSDGLIGNKIIVLYGGTPQAAPVQSGDMLHVEKTASVEDMMSTFQSNNKNILAITTDFKEVSRRLANGEGTIGKLLKEESLANDLNNTMAVLKRASVNAERLTTQFNSYAANLQKPGTLTNDLITDTVLFSRLKTSVLQVEEMTRKANEVMVTINNVSQDLQSDLKKTNTPAGVLLNDEQSAASIKETIKNLQSSTQKLDENMEALQHNFLLRGFFKKKAQGKL